MIKPSLVLPQKSSVIFGNLPQSSENFGKWSEMFVWFSDNLLENLCKSLESGWKSSKNRQKSRH